MATRLVTNNQRLNAARQVRESISEESNTRFYVFVGDHTEHNNTVLDDIYDTIGDISIDCYRNMIFGKRVEPNDVKLMIRNIPYESGTVYSMYDDRNESLVDENFFVVVNASSFYHVFKCLDNNLGAPSTVEPNFSHIIGSNTFVYMTSDGYRWKYMCSVDSANTLKFSSEELFPVISNTQVSNSAVDGAIDVIYIEGEGKGYDNYLTGVLDSADIRINGNNLIYAISNSISSAVNGFYTDCLVYISSGTGSGQYRTISNYYSNSTGKYIILDSQFATVPTNGSEYEIYPKVKINGNGTQTINAVARALVNANASNSVYRVEMLERGAGYRYATASVMANSVVSVDAISLIRPIIPPAGGHGYDVGSELYSKSLSFSVKFTNTEGNTISTNNKFQQVGLLIDPLFANVLIETANQNGVFTLNETVYEISPLRINTNVEVSAVSTTVTCDTGDFENQLKSGDYLYFKSANGLSHFVTTVNTVTNASSLEIASNSFYSDTDSIMYLARISTNSLVIGANSSHVRLNRLNGEVVAGAALIGKDSGAFAYANSVTRNGIEKSFQTFVQMYKYEGVLNSGTFEENEFITQGNSSAILHSANVDSGILTIYTTNQFGAFSEGVVNGNTSGAVATITGVYGAELIPGSGQVLFIENVDEVTRSANTSETIQIIFDY